MADVPEIAVVGAGIVGLATAYALVEQGVSVRVYESGAPGNGQSAGESRIFRHAHDDPRLVECARRSRAVWGEWEERFGVELVSRDGVVALGPKVNDRLAVLERVGGVRARAIGAAELAERIPLLAAYDGPAMIDEDGGAIRTRAAVAALAGALGDAIVTGEVVSLRATAGGRVEVRSVGECAEFACVVVCAGRDTARLARGAGLSLPVRLAAHVRLTFAVNGAAPQRIACLQDGSGAFGKGAVYATPQPGNDRYSVGLAATVAVRDDGALLEPAELAAHAERARAYASRALPGLEPQPLASVHCWTTELPWSDDGFAVWEAGRVLFVAGHNLFKQAPWLGRALARAAVGGGLEPDLLPAARLGEPRRPPT